ncbi:HNH endonuclease signature motif containing protein [Tessaracoccus sp. Z1128]
MLQRRLTTDQALGALESTLSLVDHAEREGLEPTARLRLMQRARRLAERIESLALVLTDEANRAQASMKSAGTPLTSFLAVSEQRDTREAAAQVFQARDLATHSQVRQAALEGDVSPGHAVAICKGMAQLPAGLSAEQVERAQAVFIGRAASATPRKLAQAAALVLAEVAPELMPTAAEQVADIEAQTRRARAKRSFSYGDDGDGSVWFRGSLPEVDAAPLIATLEAYVQADRRAARGRLAGVRSLRPGPQLLRSYAAADQGRTPDQRRADAFTTIVAEHRGAPTAAGDRPRIVITISEADLRGRAEALGLLASGAEIAPGDLRRLCCDADLTPAVLGAASEILDIGQTKRLVNPGIRKALSLRDGGCAFPNCTAPDSACEAHHVIPWYLDGPTSLGNMVLLCAHHHAVIEPQRFNADADQWTVTFDPVTRKPVISPTRRMQVHLASQDRPGPRIRAAATGRSPRSAAHDAGPGVWPSPAFVSGPSGIRAARRARSSPRQGGAEAAP